MRQPTPARRAEAKPESEHLSPERAARREWIGGRALTLLSHYWRDDDPEELTAAIGADWVDVLEGIPAEYIQRACVQYQRDEPRRRPTPGAIYAIAIKYIPQPRPVPISQTVAVAPRVTADQARKILDQAGFRVQKFGGHRGQDR